jgi:hypothetical protein
LPLKTRKFSATLYPTYRSKHDPDSLVTKMVIGLASDGKDNGAKTEFEAATTADVVGAVQRFAETYGGACRASVRVLEGRKPAGFDEATRDLFYNLERAEIG